MSEERKATELIKIGITSPGLAAQSEASERYRNLSQRATRPPSEAIAQLPWLNQMKAYLVGYYLLTHGLKEHAGHPELEICNVPGALVAAAAQTLNTIADYILNTGNRITHGQTLQLEGTYETIVGFSEIEPGSDPAVPHQQPVLRVLFVC